jgi:hypothetical protein
MCIRALLFGYEELPSDKKVVRTRFLIGKYRRNGVVGQGKNAATYSGYGQASIEARAGQVEGNWMELSRKVNPTI